MFCRKCGKEMPDESVFCGSCGTNQRGDFVRNEPKQSDWEATWERLHERVIDRLENGRPGGVTTVVGGQVKISYGFYTGISAGREALEESINKISPIVDKIEDSGEQQAAIKKISDDAYEIAKDIRRHTENEHKRFQTEISIFNSNVNTYGKINGKEVDDKQDAHNYLTKMVEDEIAELVKKGETRRIDEYWAKHKDEKDKIDADWDRLDEEKDKLIAEVEVLDKQIADLRKDVPQKIDGYSLMVKTQEDIKRLEAEKAKLGVFQGKRKKEISALVDSKSQEVTVLSSRVNNGKRAIEASVGKIETSKKVIESQIATLQDKMDKIDEERTKPR